MKWGGGFAAALRKVFKAEGDFDPSEFFRSRFVPDGWEIDNENRTVKVYEEVNHNPITVGKLRRFVDLWWDLDYVEWKLECYSTTAWGGETRIPLEFFVYSDLGNINPRMTLGSLMKRGNFVQAH